MSKELRTDFCLGCRKVTEYVLKEEVRCRYVKDKEYQYRTIVAYCKECGEEMYVPGLADKDLELFDAYYRKMEGIITIPEIWRLMDLYHLGKAPLSLTLGFGEVTVTRYLEGQMPSKKYSDIMRAACSYPEQMCEHLEENKDKIGVAAYKKARQAIDKLLQDSKGTLKIQTAIHYILNEVVEITPLALQKLLYFIQGLHLAIYGTAIFSDDCEAWVHGPVYPEVYNQYRKYGYNPIEDEENAFFVKRANELNDKEKYIFDLVISTFGTYSGKVLESITHSEEPWKLARNGVESIEYSKNKIPKETMKNYFERIVRQYGMRNIEEIQHYIKEIRQQNRVSGM